MRSKTFFREKKNTTETLQQTITIPDAEGAPSGRGVSPSAASARVL